tara:strand:- start:226 stop:642 length:417 start_codon:yes stop_codon:yes gene_type:complete
MKSKCIPKDWDRTKPFFEEDLDYWRVKKAYKGEITPFEQSDYHSDDRVPMLDFFSDKLPPKDNVDGMISAGNFINSFLEVHYDSNGDIYKITVKGEGFFNVKHGHYIVKQIKRMGYWFNTTIDGGIEYKWNYYGNPSD